MWLHGACEGSTDWLPDIWGDLAQPREALLDHVVQVTNELDQTYFAGPGWRQLTEIYEMEPRTKCKFFLDHGEDYIYFDYKNPDPIYRRGTEFQDENYLD